MVDYALYRDIWRVQRIGVAEMDSEMERVAAGWRKYETCALESVLILEVQGDAWIWLLL